MPCPAAHQNKCLGDSAGPTPLRPAAVPLGLCQPPTFLHHAHSQALLEATELAAVSPSLVHRAVLVSQADVLGIFLHCALGGGGQHGTRCQSVGMGGAQGREATRSYCHRRQKRSLFTAIFLTFGWQGRERWMGGGRKRKVLGTLGEGSASPSGHKIRGSGLPSSWYFLTCLRPPAPSLGQTREG